MVSKICDAISLNNRNLLQKIYTKTFGKISNFMVLSTTPKFTVRFHSKNGQIDCSGCFCSLLPYILPSDALSALLQFSTYFFILGYYPSLPLYMPLSHRCELPQSRNCINALLPTFSNKRVITLRSHRISTVWYLDFAALVCTRSKFITAMGPKYSFLHRNDYSA